MKLEPVGKLRPALYNPRKSDQRRLKLVELSLRKLGFLLPIYATADGEISSGHQRFHVAVASLGLHHVPVQRVYIDDPDKRLQLNLLFNRATNDLHKHQYEANISAEAAIELVSKLPDREERYPCLATKEVPVEWLVSKNWGRWIDYAYNVTKSLAKMGVEMPLVITPDGEVLNGIGRLQYATERQLEAVPVVEVPNDRAEAARLLLNLLSMDFDLEHKLGDRLRSNAYRRARTVRKYLGNGFIFVIHRGRAKDFNLRQRCNEWVAEYGRSVVDFGSGHGDESRMLRAVGIDVVEFEPYRPYKGRNQINKGAARRLARRFLQAVRDGRQWDSVFLSSVLNSVPFATDRIHIVRIVAALCGPETRCYAAARATHDPTYRYTTGASNLDERGRRATTFIGNYESGVIIGEPSRDIKAQKYHSPEEFYHLFKHGFDTVQVKIGGNNVEAVCAQPKPVDPDKLVPALRFEFNLPYADGSSMGLAEEALESFSERLGIDLKEVGHAKKLDV